MQKHVDLFNQSYQRAISPDFHGFFEKFYFKLINSDEKIASLFVNTDMERQIKMLMQSMTYLTSYSHTSEASDEFKFIAEMHGKDKLNVPTAYYDNWTECLMATLKEQDTKFNESIELAWRSRLSDGIEYMRSYCSDPD